MLVKTVGRQNSSPTAYETFAIDLVRRECIGQSDPADLASVEQSQSA
jgi:hypothetical protein